MKTAFNRITEDLKGIPEILDCRYCVGEEQWDIHYLFFSKTFQIICECGNQSEVFSDPIETVNDWNRGQV